MSQAVADRSATDATKTRPWRVLWQPSFFFPEPWNGIDEHLRLLARHVDRDRFDLAVLRHASDGPQTTRLAELADLPVIDAPEVYGVRRAVPALRALYQSEGIDLVHIHTPSPAGLLAPATAARLAGVRSTVVTYHLSAMRPLPVRTRALNRLCYWGMVARGIAVSSDVRETVSHHGGVPARRLTTILNGVDDVPATRSGGRLGPRRPGELRVGYFGRLSTEKGVDTLIDAMALLRDECPEVTTYLAGDGPARAQLEQRSSELGLADRLHFLGFVEGASSLMAEVDIIVHVPRYEGLPMVLLEAMAAARPLVVNKAPGGLTEAVADSENGIVTDGTPASISAAVRYLLERPEERERMGTIARRRWERLFSARAMAAGVQELYEAVLG